MTTTYQYSFNSHPHKEDDAIRVCRQPRSGSFNSHPHKEDDNFQLLTTTYQYSFNSHPHKEDDAIRVCRQPRSGSFNSHPHKEDDLWQRFYVLHLRPFNSHPHKEDDDIELLSCFNILSLSTHILTRRMTAILNKIYVIQNRTIYNFYTKMFLSFTFQPNISV